LLAIGAGLRREEIDTLLWSQFDAQKRKIDIRATKYFKPKSDQSENTVDLDDEVVAILQGYRAKAKVGTTYSYYRADPIFIRLLTWLKAQGLGGTNNRKDKPIHSLRKEFGSLLHKTYGIFAASRSLRHASIQVTESHYLDKKERTTAGLGRLAKDEQEESAV
ncbi:MAG: hypothetical protein P8J87_03235, partial [Verrucomicrobiales bacterium]|nr:hypothetical protein [Verrucomicrobiales bacterium]